MWPASCFLPFWLQSLWKQHQHDVYLCLTEFNLSKKGGQLPTTSFSKPMFHAQLDGKCGTRIVFCQHRFHTNVSTTLATLALLTLVGKLGNRTALCGRALRWKNKGKKPAAWPVLLWLGLGLLFILWWRIGIGGWNLFHVRYSEALPCCRMRMKTLFVPSTIDLSFHVNQIRWRTASSS